MPGPRLAALAIEEALKRAKCPKELVDEAIMGCAMPAGLGQAPDHQASLYAGLLETVPTTLVSKVCASGMKAIIVASLTLASGRNEVMVAGGFESMSNVPYLMARAEPAYGGVTIRDGLLVDGLTDAYSDFHMGQCAENMAEKMQIGRDEQDDYAIRSYERAKAAYENNDIQPELLDVVIKGGKGKKDIVVSQDEEFSKVNFDKFRKLSTVFKKGNGTITAANGSTLSDGGAACVLMTEEALKKHNCEPMARIVDFADSAVAPIDFPIAPVSSTLKILKRQSLSINEIDLWEINEAFSLVALANIKDLQLDPNKVNVHGGAVSLGHPLGASGTRITNRLAFALRPGQKGIASICNGGGGASAILIEKL